MLRIYEFLLNKNSKVKVLRRKNIMNDSNNDPRDSVQSMINDSIRQTITNTNFGVPKAQKEELIRLVKNNSTPEKFKQKLDSIGVQSRFIHEFLDEFMSIALESGNLDLVMFFNRTYSISLKKDTIDACIKYNRLEALQFAISTGTVRVTKSHLVQAAKNGSTEIFQWFISKGWSTLADYTILEELIDLNLGLQFSEIINSLVTTEEVYHTISCVHKALSEKIITVENVKKFILTVPMLLTVVKDPTDDELIYIAKMQQIPKDKMLEKFTVYDKFAAKKSKVNMFPLIKKYLLMYIEIKKILAKRFQPEVYSVVLSFM